VRHARWFFLCSGLLLLLANASYADGNYQRTKDDKTLIWNPDPVADDAATWSGGRDANGYATGSGTLTWYKVERKYALGSRLPVKREILVIRYSGKMVQGKLEGPVVAMDPKGKTSHATFASGIRSGEWVVGPAPTPEHPPWPSYGVTGVPSPSNSVTGPPSPSFGATSPHLQSGGTTLRSDEADSKTDKSVQQEAIAKLPAETPSPQVSAVPDKQRDDETVRRKAVVNVPVAVPPAVTSPAPSPSSGMTLSASPSYGATGALSLGSGATASPLPSAGATRHRDQRVVDRPARATRARASDFLESLVLPPSVLGPRISFLAGTSPQSSAPATSQSKSAGPNLSTAEVIGLADAEARVQGYDVGRYQRPKVDYTAADDTWSVVYDQKPTEGKTEVNKDFSVTVEDKTRKTSIVGGK
jgi:hypothetical protein